MAVKLLIRGSTIFFDATCFDTNDAPITPDTATLYIVYTPIAGGRNKVTVPMDIAGNLVSAEWDSSVAQGSNGTVGLPPGLIRWSIHADGGDKITMDGEFTLWSNEANTVS